MNYCVRLIRILNVRYIVRRTVGFNRSGGLAERPTAELHAQRCHIHGCAAGVAVS